MNAELKRVRYAYGLQKYIASKKTYQFVEAELDSPVMFFQGTNAQEFLCCVGSLIMRIARKGFALTIA